MCEKRLREMGLCSLSKGGLRENLIAIFYLLKGNDGCVQLKGNTLRLQQEKALFGYDENSDLRLFSLPKGLRHLCPWRFANIP